MRVISGEKKGKKLVSLEGDEVRPTTDRVKESLFSIIQFSLVGRNFLDLFAGSGQIAIEALSRGAKSATLVDASPKSVTVCKKNVELTEYQERARLVNAQSTVFIKNSLDMYDIAYLDPPYRKGLIEECLPFVAERMNKGGTIICEHPSDENMPELAGEFCKKKTYRYGKIMLTLYQYGRLEEVMP